MTYSVHTGLGLEPGLPGQEEEELQEGSPHWTPVSSLVTAFSPTPSRGRACPAAPGQSHLLFVEPRAAPLTATGGRRRPAFARPEPGPFSASPAEEAWGAFLAVFVPSPRASPFLTAAATTPLRVLERKAAMKGNLPGGCG